jgi:hypothetical protein
MRSLFRRLFGLQAPPARRHILRVTDLRTGCVERVKVVAYDSRGRIRRHGVA